MYELCNFFIFAMVIAFCIHKGSQRSFKRKISFSAEQGVRHDATVYEVYIFFFSITAYIAQECMDGAEKKQDCNDCWCYAGSWFCERMRCYGWIDLFGQVKAHTTLSPLGNDPGDW